jgi:putative FmdB family regulatory protein
MIMPLFEYYCNDCKKDFTLLQSANVNKEETECPDCETKSVDYKFSSFSAKVAQSSMRRTSPVTADELPKKSVLNLPLPRLRSEL